MKDAAAFHARRAAPTRALPARAGVGFKPQHFEAALTSRASLGFIEVHAENYLGAGGPPHVRLERLRRDFPLSIHGVGLSLAGDEPLDAAHLERVAALVSRYEPALFSEHLAWSRHAGRCLCDLLPSPYTAERLTRVAANVERVQEALGRRIAIENPATYVAFTQSDWPETDFLAELSRRTGCALLLDVTNVHVSALNHGFDAKAYIEAFPIAAVEEIHLAGFSVCEDESGRPLLIDAHCAVVDEAVWSLYERALARRGPTATLVEWDNDVPDWNVLYAEAGRADALLAALQPGRVERRA